MMCFRPFCNTDQGVHLYSESYGGKPIGEVKANHIETERWQMGPTHCVALELYGYDPKDGDLCLA